MKINKSRLIADAAILAAFIFAFCQTTTQHSGSPAYGQADEAAQAEMRSIEDLPAEWKRPTEAATEAKTESGEEATIKAEEEAPVRYALTDEERIMVEAVVAAESRGEDFDGQALVAQCILNTAEARQMRPDDVVLEPGQYAAPDYENGYTVAAAVAAVFDDGYTVTDEPVRYFYAPAWCSSAWHESQSFVLEYGGHRFFKAA